MKIVFCGNPEFAVIAFERLLASSHHILAVITSPDKPRGRGRKESALPVKERALQAGLPVLQPLSLKDPAFLEQVRALKPDCLVVVAFRILPRELFALPALGSFNVHPSLLPRYRGPAPIRWTLINGDRESGVSIIQLTEQIDGGGILAQTRTAVQSQEDYGDLHDRLGRLGADLLVEVLERIERGEKIGPIVQDESLVTKAPKLYPDDYRIHWNHAREAILSRIRAFSPDPGAIAKAGEFTLKILRAQASENSCDIPGKLIKFESELHIGTADGAIRLEEIKPAGKRPMPVADYLRGRPELPERFE